MSRSRPSRCAMTPPQGHDASFLDVARALHCHHHHRTATEIIMNARHKWIIVLVAHEDTDIETRVIKERLPMEEDEQFAAFLRGGELVAVFGFDNEAAAESQRVEVEKTCLR